MGIVVCPQRIVGELHGIGTACHLVAVPAHYQFTPIVGGEAVYLIDIHIGCGNLFNQPLVYPVAQVCACQGGAVGGGQSGRNIAVEFRTRKSLATDCGNGIGRNRSTVALAAAPAEEDAGEGDGINYTAPQLLGCAAVRAANTS